MARKLAPDKWLFAATVALALFGVVMVYSASAFVAQEENGNQFYYVIKQGVSVAIGFIVMLLAMQFNYQLLKNWRVVYGLLVLCTIGLIGVRSEERRVGKECRCGGWEDHEEEKQLQAVG